MAKNLIVIEEDQSSARDLMKELELYFQDLNVVFSPPQQIEAKVNSYNKDNIVCLITDNLMAGDSEYGLKIVKKFHEDLPCILATGNVEDYINRITALGHNALIRRSDDYEGIVNVIRKIRQGRIEDVESAPEGVTPVVQKVHSFRHDILSPFLPLSTSLQGFFDLKNEKAFLLLGPKYDDFYKNILSDSKLSRIRNNIAEMFELGACEGPNKGIKASEEVGAVKEELNDFVENDDLRRLCEILNKFEKQPIDNKGNLSPEYNELLKELRKWNNQGDGNRAREIIDGIKDFAENLQKVVDFVEFGEVT